MGGNQLAPGPVQGCRKRACDQTRARWEQTSLHSAQAGWVQKNSYRHYLGGDSPVCRSDCASCADRNRCHSCHVLRFNTGGLPKGPAEARQWLAPQVSLSFDGPPQASQRGVAACIRSSAGPLSVCNMSASQRQNSTVTIEVIHLEGVRNSQPKARCLEVASGARVGGFP